MSLDGEHRSARAKRSRVPLRSARRAGFTLLEVIVAMSIFLLGMTLALSAYLAALKQAVHAQNVLQGTQELRHANDMVSEAVRSAPLPPVVQSSGLQLVVAPKDLGYATVLETTWIDTLHNVKGSKSNQKMLKLSNVSPALAVYSVFAGSGRPSSTLGASDIATYFNDSSSLPTIDLNDIFASGDTITIPATAYGPQTTGVINNISNNAGNKTVTLVSNLGVDVPNGTRIAATAGRRLLFSVESSGELRYYPDRRVMTKYIVIARDISSSPLSDPSNNASAVTTPFSVSGRYLTINLQKLPRGTTAGRTVQGVQTNIYTRTDPLIQ